jgi:hypothetical protein
VPGADHQLEYTGDCARETARRIFGHASGSTAADLVDTTSNPIFADCCAIIASQITFPARGRIS